MIGCLSIVTVTFLSFTIYMQDFFSPSDALPANRTWPPSCSHGTYQHEAITSRSRQLLMMGIWLSETCWATIIREIKNTKVTSSWFFLSTLNYDARSTTHHIYTTLVWTPLDEWSARRRYLYLKKHNTYTRETPMPPSDFEPATREPTPYTERPWGLTHKVQTYSTLWRLQEKTKRHFNRLIWLWTHYKLRHDWSVRTSHSFSYDRCLCGPSDRQLSWVILDASHWNQDLLILSAGS